MVTAAATERKDAEASNKGKPYTREQIENMYKTKGTRIAKKFFAELYGRTVGAIDFVYRWIKDWKTLPENTRGPLYVHLKEIEKELGQEQKGAYLLIPTEVLAT